MKPPEALAPGILKLRRCLDAAACSDACAAVGRAIERARCGALDADDWSPTSSSLRYRAVAALPEEAFARIDAAGRDLGRELLGRDVSCDVAAAWWRCQYPPHLAPPIHRAHAWHQDGALGFDFARRPEGSTESGAVRHVVTCWIALTPCGADAPSLELLGVPLSGVLGLAALHDETLRCTHPADCFIRPVLDAGDALFFAGGVAHRTHATPSMRRARTSLELRWFGNAVSPRQACAPRSGP